MALTPSSIPRKSTIHHPQCSYDNEEGTANLWIWEIKKNSVESKKNEDEADPESSFTPAKTTLPPVAKRSKTTRII